MEGWGQGWERGLGGLIGDDEECFGMGRYELGLGDGI